MGAACCVAAGRTVTSGSPSDNLQRHARYSPSWSFRWDNRGRVAGEETHINWAQDEGCGDSRMGVKFDAAVEAALASEEVSPLDGSRSHTPRKSSLFEGNSGSLRLPSSDQATSQNIPEIKESLNSSSISSSPPLKLFSSSLPSLSSKSPSTLSSQSHHPMFPPSSTPSKWHYQSPRHPLFRQVSNRKIPKSPSFSISEDLSSLQVVPSWRNDSTRISNCGSFDSCSIPSRRERWSFESDFPRFNGTHSGQPSLDLQTCDICTQLLASDQKLMYANELAVVSVLTCGHVYHSDCLEYMTPEIDKYNPPCPVCTFGEKRALKMSEKARRAAETDPRARKRSKKRVVGSNLGGGFEFDRSNSRGARKPFLRRHFSFGAKTSSRQFADCQSTPRRGIFWGRSSRD